MPEIPPNILWISLEDCSPRLGCYGDALARTPHLDRFASEGLLYANAFSTAPVCAPARCAIITGMYAASIGAQHMRTMTPNPRAVPNYECVPPAFVKCVPEYLRAAGYFCTNNAKTDYQFSAPFTAWDELNGEAHWRHRPDGSPFFAVFNLEGTHESGMWDAENQPALKTDPAAVIVPPYLVDAPATREAIARHYDRLADVDRQAGELLAQLEQDGLADNTVVMIWSDHGNGLPRSKRWPYDSGLHVPLIVRHLGSIAAGGISRDLVSTIDLGPTVLSLAGIPLPFHMQGRPFPGPHAEKPRAAVFSTSDRMDNSYACSRTVRDARWRYVRRHPTQTAVRWIPYANRHPAMRDLWTAKRNGNLTPEQEVNFRATIPSEELYDLQNDPFEVRNLAGESSHKETLERLRAELDAWQGEIHDLYAEPEEQMARRFWPGFEQPVTQAPHWIAYDAEHLGDVPCESGQVTLTSPALLQMSDYTEGASMGYRFSSDAPDSWRLYTEPLSIPPGKHELEGKAIRIGYRESDVRRLTVTVKAQD